MTAGSVRGKCSVLQLSLVHTRTWPARVTLVEAPQTPQYYKHLGIGYAQIKRYDRSLRALEEGRRQAPNDRDIAEAIALVKSRAETQALLRE